MYFGEILFVVSLENSLQFHPCIFFPPRWFCFRGEDFPLFSFFGFGIRFRFRFRFFFFFIRALRRIMNCWWRVKQPSEREYLE